MHLLNEATIAAPPERVWATLVDLDQVAAAMPGASLEGRDGEHRLGRMKVKVGPIAVEYRGTVRFVSLDEDAHDAVLEASGGDLRGQGTASARVHARLTPAGAGTTLRVETDLHISGRVAQFGRGALQDVSARLLEVFTGRLEAVMAADGPPSTPSGGVTATVPAAFVRPSPGADDGSALDARLLVRGLLAQRLPMIVGLVGAFAVLVGMVRLRRRVAGRGQAGPRTARR